ncbi:hypothetical protein C8F01DRAFT_1125531 [Mycena amicta]|nr:hypothetical protein C8F01DRAFT_1125531 [Mycena amicta]
MEAPSTGATQLQGALPPPHPIELCLENLKGEITSLVKQETYYKEQVEKLQTELSAFKRAYTDVDAELKAAHAALREAETVNTQLSDVLQTHNKPEGHRIVMLIDGDGAIFSAQLISQGQKGGHAAAQRLSDETKQALVEHYGARAYHLWVYVFLNKQGLLNTFRRSGLFALNNKLDEFVAGFNQATERFLMIDVGGMKEAADVKLKVYLEDEIRLSETFKIIFGGCHDNGYVANLRSQITAGYKEKLILLKSYDEMASGIEALDLPTLSITDLFLAQKLAEEAMVSPPTATKTPGGPPLSGNVSLGAAGASTLPAAVSTANETPRQLDPKLPLSKQKPSPCTLYYLKNSCKLKTSCPHAHDYILTAAQLTEFAKGAKRAPCPAVNKGKDCNFGADCCYGHLCSKAPNCIFHQRGSCKFKHPSMHPSP